MPLYRAHSRSELTNSDSFINPYINMARKPLTMPIDTHNICGQWFESQHGANFRERAIFCTGSLEQAKGYLDSNSSLIEIWPIGNYHICYSERIRDLFEHFMFGSFTGSLSSETDVLRELNSLGYISQKDNGIDHAILTGCEVMLIAQNYGFKLFEI